MPSNRGPLLFSIIQAAGWPIWPLLLASVLALALIVERFLTLKRSKVLPARLYDEALSVAQQRRATPEVVNTLERNSPLGRVLAAALRHVTLQPHTSRDAAKEVVQEAGRAVAHDLERYLNALGTIASVAPLMGLLGTVIGMIEIFGSQGGTGANPEQLAHGISVALYNTAFGLVVAIPALIFWRYFRRRVDDYVAEMEARAAAFLDAILPQRRA
ncbi:MotA/TolQ/ExbB proton channel family protein [Cupriavidus respiraculi]|uniref:Tol-Pal system protein TolQ n=1 Tax=Cupriavidus respiraculi TaxID=195930 RepID=A0ABM8X3I2_9BURK|nr:Tol-Pal system protein TolQ [Cupriavidus respiraculi]